MFYILGNFVFYHEGENMLGRAGIGPNFGIYSTKTNLKRNQNKQVSFGYDQQLYSDFLEKIRKDEENTAGAAKYKHLHNDTQRNISMLRTQEEGIDHGNPTYDKTDFLAQKITLALMAETLHPELHYAQRDSQHYAKKAVETDGRKKSLYQLISGIMGGISNLSKISASQDVKALPAAGESTASKKLETPKLKFKDKAQAHDYWMNKSGIIGMEEFKEDVWDNFLRPIMYPVPSLEKEKPSAYLLYGPPGCGKTFTAGKIAKTLGADFMELKVSEMGSKYVNETSNKIGKKFKEAKEKATPETPVVLLLDEADSFLSKRDDTGDHREDNKAVNTFLQEMGQLEGTNVYALIATNHKGSLDEAGIRTGRVSGNAYLGLPEKNTRKSIIKHFFNELSGGRKLASSEKDMEEIAEKTEGYSIADLVKAGGVLPTATSMAIKEDLDEVSRRHVDAALEHTEIAAKKKERTDVRRKYGAPGENARKAPLGFCREEFDKMA